MEMNRSRKVLLPVSTKDTRYEKRQICRESETVAALALPSYVQRVDPAPIQVTTNRKLALLMGRFTAEDAVKSLQNLSVHTRNWSPSRTVLDGDHACVVYWAKEVTVVTRDCRHFRNRERH